LVVSFPILFNSHQSLVPAFHKVKIILFSFSSVLIVLVTFMKQLIIFYFKNN
jgi:hypothetical protein